MSTAQTHSGRSTAPRIAVLLLGVSLLAGCSAETSPDTASAGTEPAVLPSARPSVEPSVKPSGSAGPAETAVQELRAALTVKAKEGNLTSAPQLRGVFESVGIDPARVEVSQDVTPTGLEVDALVAAAPVEGVCVMAQVRDELVEVTTLPVLENGLCFIGDQR